MYAVFSNEEALVEEAEKLDESMDENEMPDLRFWYLSLTGNGSDAEEVFRNFSGILRVRIPESRFEDSETLCTYREELDKKIEFDSEVREEEECLPVLKDAEDIITDAGYSMVFNLHGNEPRKREISDAVQRPYYVEGDFTVMADDDSVRYEFSPSRSVRASVISNPIQEEIHNDVMSKLSDNGFYSDI